MDFVVHDCHPFIMLIAHMNVVLQIVKVHDIQRNTHIEENTTIIMHSNINIKP